jgi:citrate lyase subunit beta/citryl-CoA lyase
MTARSHLYVPADSGDKLARALDRGADALIVDLEDAVPAAGKDAARSAVASWLSRVDPGPAEVWVRVNPPPLQEADLRAVAAAAPVLSGVCLAKASIDSVAAAGTLLDSLGADGMSLAPLLEDAAAVLAAERIGRLPRVRRLQVGEADLRAELGLAPSDDERELLWVRSSVVLASAAAGIEPPVAPVSTDFRDLDRLRASTDALRRLGYLGRACIHPAQVSVVNEVFTPAAVELARARDLVARYEAAGGGVVLDAAGRMVDEAVVRSARRTLALGSRG